MQKALLRGILAVAAIAVATPQLFAQFGGAEGEAIIFMLSSKGLGGVSLASATTPNAASVLSQFQVIDPSTIPLIPADQPGDFFPNYQLRVLHSGPHDKMQLLTNLEGEPTVHHYYLITFKLFTMQGVRREYGDPGEAIMDVPPNVFASFFAGQDIGPNEAMEEEKALVWTSTPAFPPFVPSPTPAGRMASILNSSSMTPPREAWLRCSAFTRAPLRRLSRSTATRTFSSCRATSISTSRAGRARPFLISIMLSSPKG
jgi:hypothetical protein